MSQPLARLFEKWANAGDDRTFSEWLAYRRACVANERAQRAVNRQISHHLIAQAQTALAMLQRLALTTQRAPQYGTLQGMLGLLGGVWG